MTVSSLSFQHVSDFITRLYIASTRHDWYLSNGDFHLSQDRSIKTSNTQIVEMATACFEFLKTNSHGRYILQIDKLNAALQGYAKRVQKAVKRQLCGKTLNCLGWKPGTVKTINALAIQSKKILATQHLGAIVKEQGPSSPEISWTHFEVVRDYLGNLGLRKKEKKPVNLSWWRKFTKWISSLVIPQRKEGSSRSG